MAELRGSEQTTDQAEPAQTELLFLCETTADVEWTVADATLSEKLNDPYLFFICLATENVSAEPLLMLGRSATLTITRGTKMRRVTGIVSEVREGGFMGRHVTTEVVVEPALQALRHRVDTRIFQEKTVPEILEEVLTDPLAEYERSVQFRLERTYPACDYRVQYNESDFDFCERLMQEEGLNYWFEFKEDEGSETLVISDSSKQYGQIQSTSSTTLVHRAYEGGTGTHEYVSSLYKSSQMRPTKVTTRHFDWTAPSVLVEADSTASEPSDPEKVPLGATLKPDREIYEHDDWPLTTEPGGTTYGSDRDVQVKLRREEDAWSGCTVEGQSTVTGMRVGAVFDLVGHPKIDLDRTYLVIEVTHKFGGRGMGYKNDFRCIPESVPYRPVRVTPKPRIASVQTALVVGPSGEEIHTDEHGRIMVQFHWDRLGAKDEHSSCWIRVMQPWGGAGWGFVFIPRIGMEVIVSFIDGDPDRPMVIGSVYNGENLLPYSLPDEKTKSTIKTSSSLGGDGFNELRFEDKAGEEEIYVHAQKDLNEEVLNDHTTHVEHDQTNTVDNDQTELVKHDQSLTVEHDREKTVKNDETTTVEGNRTETVKKDETITIEGSRTETVKKDETITIDGNREEEVGGDEKVEIKGKAELTVKGKRKVEVKDTYDIKAADAFKLEDDKEITFKTGKSSLTLKEDGTIELKGESLTINGKTEVAIEGGKAKITASDSELKLEGPKVDVKGDDGIKLDGAKVELK